MQISQKQERRILSIFNMILYTHPPNTQKIN